MTKKITMAAHVKRKIFCHTGFLRPEPKMLAYGV